MSKQPAIGFVAQSSAPQPHYPVYPSPQQQMYPAQPPPAYPGNQPFPPPIQQQPQTYQQAPMWLNSNFQTYLTNAASFHVRQKVELLEAIVGFETGNKYSVYDQAGNKVFYVAEESGCCGRQFCNARRAFTLTFKDSRGQNVLLMNRELDCSCCCGLVCPDKLQISTPNGQLLGSVEEDFHLLYPAFKIKNALGATVLKIEGPCCPLTFGSCSGPVVFRVMDTSGVTVGVISKEWSGFVRELFTDADNFSMSFPINLDPSIKAVLLGALFLIDYQYFEQGATNKQQGGRRLFG